MVTNPDDEYIDSERLILRKLRVWIAGLTVASVAAGIGIGALLTGRPAVAQNAVQVARAPEALSASFADIAKRVEPAVVNIDTVTASTEVADRDEDDKEDQSSSSNPLLDMFRHQQRRPSRGVGSGFIVDPKGYILTNEHVIQGTTRITVRLQSGEDYRGQIVGVDPETDVAVIKVDAGHELPSVKLGDSNGAQVGDWVLAIGSPFGLEETVTAGIISTKERQDPAHFTSFQQFLQTDAAINRGNSGGPLVNMRGDVIGINSQIATSTGDYNGIGFALPSNQAEFVYRQLITTGKVRRGYLGITLESVKAQYARVFGLAEARGAVVTDVRDLQGPAGKAGIRPNDVIVEFADQQISTAQDLINKVAAASVGETLPVTLLRDSGDKFERRVVNVTLGERPGSLAPQPETPSPEPSKTRPASQDIGPRLGITLVELTQQIAAGRNLNGVKGLLIKDIDPNGIASDARPYPVRNGEVIVRINRVPVSSLGEFQHVVDGLKVGDAIVLNVASYDAQSKHIAQRIVQFTYQ